MQSLLWNGDKPAAYFANRANDASNEKAMAHWTDVSIKDIPLIPGMTQPDELRYFYWCCAALHRPGRRVVELGPYVGRSTMALAAGLRQSADPDGKVATLDRFRWDPWTLENSLGYTVDGLSPAQRTRLTPAQLNPKVDDSFTPLFQVFTEPLKDSIEAMNAVLESYEWSCEPIDVLMVDAAKSWDALDQIVRQFFPSLVDGATVIHQDYKHFFTYWLHPVTERMLDRGVLTVAENVEGTPTQGFRFHKRADFRVEDYLHSAFTAAESDRLMAQSVNRFRGAQDRLTAVGARCQFLKDHGQLDLAKSVVSQAICDGGYSDNYALADLLLIAQDWVRPLTSALLEGATKPSGWRASSASLKALGPHSVSVPAAIDGQPAVIEMPALDISRGDRIAMSFWADRDSDEPLQIRVQAADHASPTPFYNKNISLEAGSCQSAIVPLVGRSRIAITWTTSSGSPPTVSRTIKCVAPTLLHAA